MNARKRVLGWGAWFRSNVNADTIKTSAASLGMVAVLLRGETRQNAADKNVASVVVANEQRYVANEERSLANEARLDSLIRAMKRYEDRAKHETRKEELKAAEAAKPGLLKRSWSWLTGWTKGG